MIKRLITAALLASTVVSAPAFAQDLRIAMPTFTDVFHPADWGNDTAPMFYQVFETLITRDPFARPLTYVPGLATAWEQVEPTIWELTLREGVVIEPLRVCRRLQLLSRMEHDEQDHEQVFP